MSRALALTARGCVLLIDLPFPRCERVCTACAMAAVLCSGPSPSCTVCPLFATPLLRATRAPPPCLYHLVVQAPPSHVASTPGPLTYCPVNKTVAHSVGLVTAASSSDAKATQSVPGRGSTLPKAKRDDVQKPGEGPGPGQYFRLRMGTEPDAALGKPTGGRFALVGREDFAKVYIPGAPVSTCYPPVPTGHPVQCLSRCRAGGVLNGCFAIQPRLWGSVRLVPEERLCFQH